MAQPSSALTAPDVATSEAPTGSSRSSPGASPGTSSGPSSGTSGETTPWREVVQLLRRASQLATEHGVDSDLFMQAAWAACLDARPGLREQLADKELRAQLKKLRKRGLVASA